MQVDTKTSGLCGTAVTLLRGDAEAASGGAAAEAAGRGDGACEPAQPVGALARVLMCTELPQACTC